MAAAAAEEQEAEVADRIRAEVAETTVLGRLRAARGARVQVGTTPPLTGRIGLVGPDWFLLTEAEPSGRDAVIPLAAVSWFVGLGDHAVPAAAVGVLDQRLDLALALRWLARERVELQVDLRDGTVVQGVLGRVGADVVDVAPLTWRGSGRPVVVRTVPLRSLAVLRAAG